ncbi:endolytic transglycosylase MltG [Streptomyces sp. NPDC053755]|uniref:endolytic transglycosylase MltG n=1 Tax=Streptomyces sp. NPDC053755 TaxID=3155815 RepID=UPI00341BE689
MTEYGRSPGSEPWHPTDPLYGDQGWEGQQQYPQQAQYGHQDAYGQGQGVQGGGQDGRYYDPQYQQPYQQEQPQHPQAPQQYDDRQYVDQTYGGQSQGYDTPGYPAQQYDTNWETGQAAMPYGGTPADPYGGQDPDLYRTPEAYPPPQPPSRRQGPPEPVTDWDAEAQEEEKHPFFTGDDDPEDDEEAAGGRPSRGGRDRRGKGGKSDKGRKGRNGVACLVVALVLAGGVGGVGYFGYQFWQGQFGAAPDYAGTGSGSVQIEIPRGSGGYDIGNILKKAGVVKSVDAFVSAQQKNPKGLSIQAGVYTLKKEMSAESAVSLLLSPASQANFVIPEGRRNTWVYDQIDKRLDLAAGTTKDIAKAKADDLGLPDWAKNHKDVKDPLEGFLFPASYPVAKGNKPEDVLRKMVARANQEYGKLDLETKSRALGLKGPWELVTVASLVQAEGKTHDDFTKMAEVIYNRLSPENKETYQLLQFDSSYNYLMGQSKIKIGRDEINSNPDPYNTYKQKGLTPGPIGNPGAEALVAALNPTKDGWMYFVATDGMSKTEFAKTLAEHDRLVEKFNASGSD